MHALLVTVDAAYAGILNLFLKCLQRYYPDHPRLIVCTSGWTPELFQPFCRQFPLLEWLDAADLRFPKGPPPVGHIPSMDRPVMYARWAALTSRFDAYDTVLYLDVDMLVLGPLDELFTADRLLAFEEAYPHRNTLVFRDPADERLRQMLVKDGLGDENWQAAANAGVLALPRRYRTQEQLAEVERLAERYGPYLMWGDQSVLNLWLARNGLRPVRNFRFNYQVRLIPERRERNVYADAKILHFNGQQGETLYLMALSYALATFVPWGRRLIPSALRFVQWPGLAQTPGYRIRQMLRRQLLRWVTARSR